MSQKSTMFCQLPTPNHCLIGHRGAAALAPENTLCGFIRAAELGLNWVEFDVQRCASGEWVVLHDDTLDRTTNGQGRVVDTSYAVIKALDAGSWFHARFKNERVPTLQEVLSCLITLKCHPTIDIKRITGTHADKTQHMRDLLGQVRAVWPQTLPSPLMSSVDLELLIILRELDAHLPLGYIQRAPTEESIQVIQKHHLNSLHCHYSVLTPTSFLYTTGIPLLPYTVNETAVLQMLLQRGVLSIFSDLTQFDI